MSYIRPLSNPEALYVIRNFSGHAEFMGVPDWGGKHRPEVTLSLPSYIFEKLMLKFLDTHDEVRYRGAALVELTQERLGGPAQLSWDFNHPDLFKYRLTYDRWGAEGVNAWTVTWCYIGEGIKQRYA